MSCWNSIVDVVFSKQLATPIQYVSGRGCADGRDIFGLKGNIEGKSAVVNGRAITSVATECIG